MKPIVYIRGGKGSNTAIKVVTHHLHLLGHEVVRSREEKHDVTLCWGCSWRESKTLNGRVNRYNKLEHMEIFQRNGIPSPITFKDWRLLRDKDFPVLARNIHHSKGLDIIPCKTKQEAAALVNEKDFFTSWIPTDTEYRVWVLRNNAFAVYEKVFKGEGEYEGFSRNHRMGFKFVRMDNLLGTVAITRPCIQAVKAIDLDWGAVDLLKGKDEKYYVLEVNSMPHIDNIQRSSGIRLAAAVSKWSQDV